VERQQVAATGNGTPARVDSTPTEYTAGDAPATDRSVKRQKGMPASVGSLAASVGSPAVPSTGSKGSPGHDPSQTPTTDTTAAMRQLMQRECKCEGGAPSVTCPYASSLCVMSESGAACAACSAMRPLATRLPFTATEWKEFALLIARVLTEYGQVALEA
jgi:hypothetical protein